MKYFFFILSFFILACEPEEKKKEISEELPYSEIPFNRSIVALTATSGGKLLIYASNDSVYLAGPKSLTKGNFLVAESVKKSAGNSSQLFLLSAGGNLVQVDTLFNLREFSLGGGSTINSHALACNEDSVFLSLSTINYKASVQATATNQFKTFRFSGLNFNQDATSAFDSRLTNSTYIAFISAKVGTSTGFYFGWRNLNSGKYRFTSIPENVTKYEILPNNSVLTDKYLVDSLGFTAYTWTFKNETLVRFSQSSQNNLYAVNQTDSEFKFRRVQISNLGSVTGDLLLTLPKSVWKFITMSKNTLVVQNSSTKYLRTYSFPDK